MYAIIDEGGRQHKVTAGDTLNVDRAVEEGATTITFDRVLLVGGAGATKVGQPTVAGATVTAEVIGETLGKKIDIFTYKRRKGYRKHKGHRQPYTAVKITAINA